MSWGHPVPFKEAIGVTSLNQSYQSDTTVAYAFGRRAAIAVRVMNFDNRNDRMTFYASQMNFILERINTENYQANVYLSAAVGPMTFNQHEHSAILTSLDSDIESRWLFLSGRAEKMWTGVGSDFWHFQSRFGFAPYAAGFNQVATWMMIQYEYNPLLSKWSNITPLIRMLLPELPIRGRPEPFRRLDGQPNGAYLGGLI